MQKRMGSVTSQFEALEKQFERSEEYSRIARKASDNLQEEYCRIIHTVATERKRNLMYIEKAKGDFINDITHLSQKVKKCEELRDTVNKVKTDQLEIGKTLCSEMETKSLSLTRFVEKKIGKFETSYVTSDDTLQTIKHQLEMFRKDNNRLDKELNMTDFYLNKMLPISQFTQTMTTLRTVMDDEE
jgi:hypothetical protein